MRKTAGRSTPSRVIVSQISHAVRLGAPHREASPAFGVSRGLRPPKTHAASLKGEGRNCHGFFLPVAYSPIQRSERNTYPFWLQFSSANTLPTRQPTPHPPGC